jgi:SAM-dependent methyltransferase
MRGAAIGARDRVLDIGCGNGETTILAARAGHEATGIDLSSPMIDVARARAAAEQVSNAAFIVGDAQTYTFEPSSFDLAISRTGTMFFDDPVAAFANVAGALAAGGRLVMIVWRDFALNEWIGELRRALAAGRDLPAPPSTSPSPFAFADATGTTGMLNDAGFATVALDPVDEPFFLGPNADKAFAAAQNMVIVQGLLRDLDERARAGALDELRRTVDAHETKQGVLFRSSSWLVRATLAG